MNNELWGQLIAPPGAASSRSDQIWQSVATGIWRLDAPRRDHRPYFLSNNVILRSPRRVGPGYQNDSIGTANLNIQGTWSALMHFWMQTPCKLWIPPTHSYHVRIWRISKSPTLLRWCNRWRCRKIRLDFTFLLSITVVLGVTVQIGGSKLSRFMATTGAVSQENITL